MRFCLNLLISRSYHKCYAFDIAPSVILFNEHAKVSSLKLK